MIKIIIKITIIILFALLILNIVSYLILKSPSLSNKFKIYSIGTEVYESIALSNKYHDGKNTVILGDSVARQLITEGAKEKIDVIDLTCNQAISLAGQYSLLSNIIKCNPQIKRVNLLYLVNSFANNLNQKFTYNYFIKPFYIGNEDIFTSDTQKIVRNKALYVLYNLPIAKVLPVFGNIDYTIKYNGKERGLQLSDTSVEYLRKMQNLCREHNIEFKAYPTPVSVKKYRSYDYIKDQIKQLGFNEIFDGYFDKLIVLSNDFYVKDHVHIKPEYINFVSDFSLNYLGLRYDVLNHKN